MEPLTIITIIIIVITTIITALRISARIKDNGKKDDLITFLIEEIQKTRQLQIYILNWERREKEKPGAQSSTKEEGLNSIGFRPLPKELEEKLQPKRPIRISDNQSVACVECSTPNLREYLYCTEKYQDILYRTQIKNWWDIIVTGVICSIIVLFSLTIIVDNGFGAVTQATLGMLIVASLYYIAKCYWNDYQVMPNELGSKRFLGIPVGDVGQGRRWLWWLIETIVKEPATDHVISIDFEDIPIPIMRKTEEEIEKIPNIKISIKTLWRYQNLTKALARIGSGEIANKNIKEFLHGQIRALINVHFAEAEGDLKMIMQRCGYLGEDVDRIIQDLIINYWKIDIDPVAVEPDTPEGITTARNLQAESEYGIRTAQNKAAAKVAELSANIKYLELIKESKGLAIDETTMKAIVVGTVLKDTIVGIGSKLNLFAADKGLLDSVFNLFGKPSGLPKGESLEKGIQTLDPETAKKLAAMYDMFMKVKEP